MGLPFKIAAGPRQHSYTKYDLNNRDEVQYRLDICSATDRAHIKICLESYVLRKKKDFSSFPLYSCNP
jgi:hypothetical protein